MDIKAKKSLLLLVIVFLALSLGGCRTRTGAGGQTETPVPDASGLTDEGLRGEEAWGASPFQGPSENGETDDAGGKTSENPEAPRKEYDENAPAEIVPDTDRLIHDTGEGNGAPASNQDSETGVSRLNGEVEEEAVQTVAAGDAERMGVSEDAEAADSALTYYSVLLQDRMGGLFECQRLTVYWETDLDHVTVHKTSPEHDLILNAGCYDVSARLLPENLTVDDGWVARKNPGVIVKIVDGSVLGGGIGGDGRARAVYESLRAREGWAAVDAVRNRRILLLSKELLDTPYLQTAAMVLIAKTANPDLFTDVDGNKMLQMLTEEATGALPTGIYYYREDGP